MQQLYFGVGNQALMSRMCWRWPTYDPTYLLVLWKQNSFADHSVPNAFVPLLPYLDTRTNVG